MCDARRPKGGGGWGAPRERQLASCPRWRSPRARRHARSPEVGTHLGQRGPRGSPRCPHLGIFFGKTEPKTAKSLTQQAKVSQKRPKIIKTEHFFLFRPHLGINAALRRPGVTGAPRAAPPARPARGGGHPGSAPGKHPGTSGQRGPSRGAPHPPPPAGRRAPHIRTRVPVRYLL